MPTYAIIPRKGTRKKYGKNMQISRSANRGQR